jgi:hypothetical protein
MIFVRQDLPPREKIGHWARCLRPALHRSKGYVVGLAIFTGKLEERGLV